VSKHEFLFSSIPARKWRIIGPAIFGMIGQLTSGSRWGIISVVVLFVTGALILGRVDESEGRRLAETVEASA
jgi:MFS transporter, UMF1 family